MKLSALSLTKIGRFFIFLVVNVFYTSLFCMTKFFKFFSIREMRAQESKTEPRNKNMYEGYNFDNRRQSMDSYKDVSS